MVAHQNTEHALNSEGVYNFINGVAIIIGCSLMYSLLHVVSITLKTLIQALMAAVTRRCKSCYYDPRMPKKRNERRNAVPDFKDIKSYSALDIPRIYPPVKEEEIRKFKKPTDSLSIESDSEVATERNSQATMFELQRQLSEEAQESPRYVLQQTKSDTSMNRTADKTGNGLTVVKNHFLTPPDRNQNRSRGAWKPNRPIFTITKEKRSLSYSKKVGGMNVITDTLDRVRNVDIDSGNDDE